MWCFVDVKIIVCCCFGMILWSMYNKVVIFLSFRINIKDMRKLDEIFILVLRCMILGLCSFMCINFVNVFGSVVENKSVCLIFVIEFMICFNWFAKFIFKSRFVLSRMMWYIVWRVNVLILLIWCNRWLGVVMMIFGLLFKFVNWVFMEFFSTSVATRKFVNLVNFFVNLNVCNVSLCVGVNIMYCVLVFKLCVLSLFNIGIKNVVVFSFFVRVMATTFRFFNVGGIVFCWIGVGMW